MRIKLSIGTLLLALLMLAPAPMHAGIIFSIAIAPPPLPVYVQPVCPGDGYIWTPGYWAYDDVGGYFWVPGTWILAPEPGFLWTPGYWGWSGTAFIFHEGYWGPHIGFYGGINYGFGYIGVGFVGGYWQGNRFFYNRAYSHVEHVTNVYNKTVVMNDTWRNVSYNGGAGGITTRATAEEEAAARDRHIAAVTAQTQHIEAARQNRQLFESVNHGRPAIAATARPGEFGGHDVVAAKSAGPSYRPVEARSAGPERAAGGAPPPAPRNAVHPSELAPMERATSNSGNAKADRKFQEQQDKLFARQNQERQQLQQKQEQEHHSLEQHHANEAQKQKVEQKHQQQTQQLAQRHAQQQQSLQRSMPKPKR